MTKRVVGFHYVLAKLNFQVIHGSMFCLVLHRSACGVPLDNRTSTRWMKLDD